MDKTWATQTMNILRALMTILRWTFVFLGTLLEAFLLFMIALPRIIIEILKFTLVCLIIYSFIIKPLINLLTNK